MLGEGGFGNRTPAAITASKRFIHYAKASRAAATEMNLKQFDWVKVTAQSP